VKCLVRIHMLAGAAGVYGVSNDTSNGCP
jgi:hypothetical protein